MKYKSVYKRIGRAIKKAREKKGIDASYLGDLVGLSRPSIVLIEQGKQTIMLHDFYKIARILKINVREALG